MISNCREVTVLNKKNVLIIANPKAGKMKAKKALSGVIKIFKDNGYLITVAFTKGRSDATKIVKKKAKKYELVVCCGGDGTLNEVIAGLSLLSNPPKLGYIPTGSTNDFAAGLKLSKNVISSAKKIIAGKSYPIDLGTFNGRTFAYIASFGAFTEVSYSTPQEIKNLWGHMAYLLEGIKDIKNIKPYKVCVKAGDNKYEGEYIFGAVTNAMSIGGILKLDPKVAKLDDGLFEVMLVKMPKNIMELHRIINCFIRRHFDDVMITFVQASQLEIEASKEMNWSLDGEYQKGTEKINIENRKHALRIIM